MIISANPRYFLDPGQKTDSFQVRGEKVNWRPCRPLSAFAATADASERGWPADKVSMEIPPPLCLDGKCASRPSLATTARILARLTLPWSVIFLVTCRIFVLTMEVRQKNRKTDSAGWYAFPHS